MSELLIGSNNQYKQELYREMLEGDEITVVTPADLGIKLDIIEDLYNIVGNSWKKARAFAKTAGMLALSDDSGIFIPALNNEPGVAARRWAGELSGDVSDEDWIEYFLQKTANLADDELAVTKSQVITIAKPSGHIRWAQFDTPGTLLREPSPAGYTPGGPFGAYYSVNEFGKAESELTPEESGRHQAAIKEKILQSVKELTKPRTVAHLKTTDLEAL
jgi:XTP/dITP diphosphohydrolase